MTDTEYVQRLVGQRFSTDFLIVAVLPDGNAVLQRQGGELYQISVTELRTVIERDFIQRRPS